MSASASGAGIVHTAAAASSLAMRGAGGAGCGGRGGNASAGLACVSSRGARRGLLCLTVAHGDGRWAAVECGSWGWVWAGVPRRAKIVGRADLRAGDGYVQERGRRGGVVIRAVSGGGVVVEGGGR